MTLFSFRMSTRAQLLLSALMLICFGQHYASAQQAVPPPMCGGDPFDPLTTMCCQGEPIPIELPMTARNFMQCCGDIIIDNRTAGCCAGEPFVRNEGICCGGTLHQVDPLAWGCCGGALYELAPALNCCANSDVYDVTEEICCGGQILGYPALTHTCCGPEALPRTGSRRCCGPQASYDVQSEVCCKETVVQALECPTEAAPTTIPGATNMAGPEATVHGATAAPTGSPGQGQTLPPSVHASPLADVNNNNVPAGAAAASQAPPLPIALDLPRPQRPLQSQPPRPPTQGGGPLYI